MDVLFGMFGMFGLVGVIILPIVLWSIVGDSIRERRVRKAKKTRLY